MNVKNAPTVAVVPAPDIEATALAAATKTFGIGGIAGITAKTVIAPFDRMKIVFQTTNMRFSFLSLYKLMKTTVVENGITSLWRGHSLTILRTFPYAGMQFMTFDIYKKILTPSGQSDLPPVRRFLAGSLAGATASVAVYPLELLRSRMAVQHLHSHGSGKAEHLGLLLNMRFLVNTYGYRGLYFGIYPALVGMVPYGGIAFGTFESLKVMTIQYSEQKHLDPLQRAVFGALAGLIAQSLTYPLDIVRRRMQTEGAHDLHELKPGESFKHCSRRYTGVIQTLQLVYSEEGVRGLYKGVSLAWIKGPLSLAISFSTFDALKSVFGVQV